MLTDFQRCLTDRLIRKIPVKSLNMSSHLKHVATYVQKNRHIQELSVANCHPRLSCSKQILKNTCLAMI